MAEMTLAQLARDLAKASASIVERSAAVVAKGALNIKTDARANATASSGTHAKLYPPTIGYDIEAGGLGAAIGPEKRGQGNLGAILEYGSGSAKNPPHRDLGRAMDAEEPRFMAEAAKLALPWA